MADRRWSCDRDLSTRKPKGSAGLGRGDNDHAVVGGVGDSVYRYFVRFADSYDDAGPDAPAVGTITRAELHLTGSEDAFEIGTNSYVLAHRCAGPFKDSSSPSYVTAAYDDPKVLTDLRAWKTPGPATDGDPVVLDVTSFVQKWAPSSVLVLPTGGAAAIPGKGEPNHGIRLRTNDDGKAYQSYEVKGQSGSVAVDKRPYIRVFYDPKNQPPIAQWDSPESPSSTGTRYTGSYADPEGRVIKKAQVRVYVRDGTDIKWGPIDGIADDTWPDGRYDMPPPPVGTLPKKNNAGDLIEYEGQVRVQDSKDDLWSDWTPKTDGRFTIDSTAPDLALVALNTQGTLNGVRFKTKAPTGTGTQWVEDPSAGGLASYIVQLVARTTSGSAAWLDPIWDSGPRPVTVKEQSDKQLNFEYTGPDLVAGLYSWRLRVIDGLNETSDWAYDHTLNLTSTYISPDEQDETAAYARAKVKNRIVLRAVNQTPGAKRRPGAVVAVIEDPANLGVSANATTPGQLYFTLPNRHPQVAVIEPFATHYRVEQYRASGWTVISEGYINDFDASDTDTIFYGLDYVGMLSLSIEAKDQPDDKSEAEWPAGAKYLKKRISFVIKDQLSRAIGEDNAAKDLSPLGFFTIPSTGVEPMDNDVTIHSAYVQRLDFIRGLIDSYKGGGLGRKPRITARSNPATGVYEFVVRADAGKNRPNLRLQYGGLVQGYRVMALGDFAVQVYGVGRKRNELKPMFRTVVAPGGGVLDAWGNISKAALWSDLSDENDLIRRTRQMVNEVSRVGKRIALGLRVGSLLPEDGWAICDSVPVDIIDGTVDTRRYGSTLPDGYGYWTIHGWEYRLFPDGHDEMTLVTKPKEVASTADPDLIPSNPIHNQPEWRVASGPPTPVVSPKP